MSAVATIFPSVLPILMVVAMRRAEARIHRQFEDAGAFAAESAIRVSFRRSLDKRRLEGLVRGGAVRVAAEGCHFLDREGWSDFQSNRRRRVVLAIAIVLAAIGIAAAAVFALL